MSTKPDSLLTPAETRFLRGRPGAAAMFLSFAISFFNPAAAQENKTAASRNFSNTKLGVSLIIGGNQEIGLRLFASATGVAGFPYAGLEGGGRMGVNVFHTYKSGRFIVEGTAAWYLGAVLGCTEKQNYYTAETDEFRFAGSSIPAKMKGLTWGIGGVGLLTSPYKHKRITNYLGTQYIKLNMGNVTLTINHTNDALMTGFWLRKFLPPILGFYDTDWDRTTELSATLSVMQPTWTISAYQRISLFTPRIAIDNISQDRQKVLTGNTRTVNGKTEYQWRYVLDPYSHGTFFSFCQAGVTAVWLNYTANINFSWGDPRPAVQNDFAHDHGYRFPLFVPDSAMSPNQSGKFAGGQFSLLNK